MAIKAIKYKMKDGQKPVYRFTAIAPAKKSNPKGKRYLII
jgi:hypothetical protein